MKVSFLVTYYNQQDYVEESMNSILNIKKEFDWEILVGDDGSTDGTLEKIEEFVKIYPDKIKVFIMDREYGKKYDSVKRASANRLNLIKNMSGDLFCIIDGDDYYCDVNFVEQAVKIYEKNCDISVVAFGYKYVKEMVDTKKIMLPKKYSNKIVDRRIYLMSYYLHAGACVYKKNWGKDREVYLLELGFYDDNNILINNLNYGQLYFLPKIVYAYRQNDFSIFNSMNKLEQAVLNVHGLDIDIKLVNDELKNSILIRNIFSIKTMFLYRKKLKNVLGEEKYKKYYVACEEIEESLAYSLFKYDSISIKSKLNIIIMMIECYAKKFFYLLREKIF